MTNYTQHVMNCVQIHKDEYERLKKIEKVAKKLLKELNEDEVDGWNLWPNHIGDELTKALEK